MCQANLNIRLPNGQPASFASVTVYEVRRFLWWEYDSWVSSKTANVYGSVSFDLVQGRKYHFVFKHVSRKGDLWRIMDYCPTQINTSFPY